MLGIFALGAVLTAVGALLLSGDDDDDDGNGNGVAIASVAPSPTRGASTATPEPAQGQGQGSGQTGSATQTPAAAMTPTNPAAPTAQSAAATPPTATPPAPAPAPATATNAATATVAAPATATATAAVTAPPEVVGSGRTLPLPLGQAGVTPDGDWEVQVVEVHRGHDAWDRIIAANQFNSPPPPGMEYALAQVRVTYLGTSAEAQEVGTGWFTTTGDARVRWTWISAVEPEPMLEAELFSGGEIVGWIAMQAQQDETNLVMIFEPLISSADGDELFLALDDGASIAPVTARLAEPNEIGFDRQDPVALGERVVGDVWEIWVIESVRGDAALQLLKEANQFNDDPAAGLEYVLVRVGARNVSTEPGSQQIEQYAFSMTGDQNRVYDLPSLVEPEPSLSYDVYAGGEVSGWIALECAVGETNLRLMYEPLFSFTGEPRFFALE